MPCSSFAEPLSSILYLLFRVGAVGCALVFINFELLLGGCGIGRLPTLCPFLSLFSMWKDFIAFVNCYYGPLKDSALPPKGCCRYLPLIGFNGTSFLEALKLRLYAEDVPIRVAYPNPDDLPFLWVVECIFSRIWRPTSLRPSALRITSRAAWTIA